MKKLNKKGFTLVELLAVIVILALLIVVVANTALPAMKNAKVNTLEIYAKRVVEQAKSLKATNSNLCTSSSKCTVKNIMGNEVTDYTSSDIEVSGTVIDGFTVKGSVSDTSGNTVYICDNAVQRTACAS